MTNVFLTGDRQMHPQAALVCAASAVNQLALETVTSGDELTISTGDNKGFEAGVRQVLEKLKVPFELVATNQSDETGKPDWDERHTRLEQLGVDKVVLVHPEPLASSIGASAMKVLADKVVIAQPVAL